MKPQVRRKEKVHCSEAILFQGEGSINQKVIHGFTTVKKPLSQRKTAD